MLHNDKIYRWLNVQDMCSALGFLVNESAPARNAIEHEIKPGEGNLTDAHSAILQVPLQSEKLGQFVEDGKQLIFWMQQNQAFGRYDSVQKVILTSRLFPDPTNDSYTTNKYFWGATGEFPMYFPKEAPEERSFSTTMNEYVTASVSVYPNPCREYIRINASMEEKELATFELFDSMGRAVFFSTFNSHGHDPLLTLRELPAGSYVWRIVSERNLFTGKIQVR